jgi:predicted ATPase/DNA-binding SARP family transcriptional activator
MSPPPLRLLGPPLLDGQPLPDERPTQLLVLLAMAPAGLARADVAAQLWPELPAATALRNLRKTLHRLRARHGPALIDADAPRLLLCAPTDVAAAERLLADGRAVDALPLLRGPLADGVAATQPPGWLLSARERALALWRALLLSALPALGPARAEAEIARLRALDPLDEALLRAHLERLAADGRREAFLRERRAFEQRLDAELGLPLPPGLRELAAPAPASSLLPAAAGAAADFIGRDDELERLEPLLDRPGLRLVLRGPGGVGKTRLAGELARRALARGRAVVWWPLAEAADAAAALARLAAELGAERADAASLAALLARRPTLVVADNAEDLLDAGPAFADALTTLWSAAPEAGWLLTSRVAPPPAAWHELALGGLDLPDPADPPGAVLRSGAVRLLVARAQLLRPDFEPRPHAAALAALARALAGHPLALELAAAQLRTAAPETLAREAARGDAAADDLDALFEASWQALQPPLQNGLALLATLPASLSRAVALAGSALRPAALQALMLRSLLESEPGRGMATATVPMPAAMTAAMTVPIPTPTWAPTAGPNVGPASGPSAALAPAADPARAVAGAPGSERLRLHPLLRAWLLRRHPPPPAEARAAARRAADAVLADGAEVLAPGGTDRPGALDWLEVELPCLRLAFELAVEAADGDRLGALTPALASLFDSRGRRDEGNAMLAAAATRLARAPLAARGAVQSARAMLAFRAGRHDEAVQLARPLRRAPPRLAAAGARTEGLALWQRGLLGPARTALERSHALALEHGLDDQLVNAINNLAILDQVEGREDEAERGYRDVARRAEARGAVRLQALALMNLGSLLHPLGRGRAALEVLRPAEALVEAHGLTSLRSGVHANLAGALLAIGDAEAMTALRALLPRARASTGAGERHFQIALLQAEALLHLADGDPAAAWPPLRAAWHETVALGLRPHQAGIAHVAAQAWAAARRRSLALAWLAWLRHQTPQWEADRREAARHWERLAPDADEAADAERAAAALDLEALGRAIEAGTDATLPAGAPAPAP